jgi:HK97 family phage prohead protease
MEPDFSGWVTKAGLKCTDGRVIAHGAFAGMDGQTVPLMYQHKHDQLPLGNVVLKHMAEGVWGDCFLNESSRSQDARAAVKHKDLTKFSVWAGNLNEEPDYAKKQVMVHDGEIHEVSLVLKGANPGALITNVMAHAVEGVGYLDPEEDLLVVSGEIMHSEGGAPAEEPKKDGQVTTPAPPATEPATADPAEEVVKEAEKTVEDHLNSLTPEQRTAVNQHIDTLVPELVTQALTEEPSLQHNDSSGKGNNNMSKRNLFMRGEGSGQALGAVTAEAGTFAHAHQEEILLRAKGRPDHGIRGFNEDRSIGSLREFIRSDAGKEFLHADDYGIQNIELLFPDAKTLQAQPTFIDRRQEWVKVFLNGTGHTPFSRVKTRHADLTADEARARGWIRGNRKNEEVFPIFQRTTGPSWIYKKQALDRQDIIDIVDFDVVAWMKVEMRGKLDEEIARAALFGDGRPAVLGSGEANPDKIKDPQGPEGNGIRSIVNDDDLYAYRVFVPLAEDVRGVAWNALLDASVEADEFYRGSGNKVGFVSFRTATRLLTMRDADQKRLYRNLDEVAGDMGLARLVKVPTELFPEDVLCIALDLSDYNFGTDRGGEISLFDDFDIHFNKYYYLMETYLSGALVQPYSAIIFMRVDPTGDLVEDIPAPTKANNVVTIPTATGVSYRVVNSDGTTTAKVGGDTITLNDTNQKTVTIEAVPASEAFYFATDADVKDSFNFRYSAPSS